MKLLVILISAVAMVASAPTETKDAVINVEGPEGRHVQTGEPGKAVSGYFTSRDKDGVEYKTTYEADEKGFRATGSHLPVSPTESFARPPIAWPVHYPISAFPIYGSRYGPQNYLPFPYPIYQHGKYLEGEDSLAYDNTRFKQGESGFPLSEDEILALAQDAQSSLTPEQIATLTQRGPLMSILMPLIVSGKINALLTMFINRILPALL